jgi:hypothetical protein
MNMKKYIAQMLLLGTLAILVGCVSPPKGPAYGQEQEFRRQLAESIPVKKYGYTIKDLMFSDDYRRALVIFTHTNNQPGGTGEKAECRPDWEFTLDSNGFRRYKGADTQPFYTPGTAYTPLVEIRVILPEK